MLDETHQILGSDGVQIASSVEYDGDNHTLSIKRDDGSTETFPAQNNPATGYGKFPGGSHPYAGHIRHGRHKDEKGRLDDSTEGAYGPNGGYVFSVPGHKGLEVHSGRAHVFDRRGHAGPAHVTHGCVRTIDAGTNAIQRAIDEGDPPTKIDVFQHNPDDRDWQG